MNQEKDKETTTKMLGEEFGWYGDDEENEPKTYTAKLHIPVIEFGFVELEIEDLTAPEIATIFKDITKAFKPKIEIPKNNNNSILLCNVCNTGNMVERYSKKYNKRFLACNKFPQCKNARNI